MSPNPPVFSRCITAAAVLVSLLAAVACAEPLPGDSAATTSHITGARLTQVGFDGYYKVGRWTRVVVQVDAAGPATVRLVAHAPDPEGCPTSIPWPAQIDPTDAHSITALFKNGRLGAQPRFEVVEVDTDGRALRTQSLSIAEGVTIRPALPQAAFLAAVLGTPAGFDEPTGRAGSSDTPEEKPADLPVALARFESGQELPADPRAFESLDVLVIAGRYDLGEPQSTAVREWVRLGGHLVVSVGADVAAYANSPLGGWISGPARGAEPPIPLASTEPTRLRELSGLESFSAQRIPIVIPGRGAVPAARLDASRGNPLVRERGDVPLVVRAPYGFGRITIIGVDVDRPPLSEWPSMATVMSRLVGLSELQHGGGVPVQTGRLAHTGVTDLASQLARANRAFPEVERSSLWTVLGLLLGYLLVIGPLDFLVVHRLLRRPHLTWLTFPLLVTAAAVLAGWTAQRTNGERVRINRLELMDIDGEFQTVRTRSWLTLYAPETQRFAVGALPALASPTGTAEADPSAPLVSWSGTPENVFGGMYRAAGLEVGRPPYELAAHAQAIQNLPLSVWATKDVEAQWHSQGSSLVEMQLARTAVGQLRGRLTHHLPGTIHDWMVAFGRRVYLPSRRGEPVPLRPGSAWPGDGEWETLPQRELTAWLTEFARTQVIRERSRHESTDYRPSQRKYDPFNPANADPAEEILRMITFHRAAGGKAYTGLDNHGLRHEELTQLLDAGRAVLFGRIDLSATEFQINGEPSGDHAGRRSTFVRIVLPVTSSTP